MRTVLCQWVPHSLAKLAVHSGLEHLSEEPMLTVRYPTITRRKFVRPINETTLFINWHSSDRPEIKAYLKNGTLFVSAVVKEEAQGFVVSGLTRDADVKILLGRELFASIAWERLLDRVPRVVAKVFPGAQSEQPGGLIFEPAGSENRLLQLYNECFGSEDQRRMERLVHAYTGVFRAVLLRRLGAEITVSEEVVLDLSRGPFHDHYDKYWLQMKSMHAHLLDDSDWRWAAKHLVPPRLFRSQIFN